MHDGFLCEECSAPFIAIKTTVFTPPDLSAPFGMGLTLFCFLPLECNLDEIYDYPFFPLLLYRCSAPAFALDVNTPSTAIQWCFGGAVPGW